MFSHQRSHDAIVDKVQTLSGVPGIKYNMYPFNEGLQLRWMMDHQQAHNDFTGPLGLDSTDLQNVDLKDTEDFLKWLHDHWQEHLNADRALGL